MFGWYRQVAPRERKTFWACSGGGSLDGLEVQMFGLATELCLPETRGLSFEGAAGPGVFASLDAGVARGSTRTLFGF